MFQPQYQLTNSILADLTAIAEARAVIERAKILPTQELRLRRQAAIRMTHHSTEIEGNQLNLQQVAAVYANKQVDAADRDIYEVQNYIAALKYIEKIVADKKPITEAVILRIHKLVTSKTMPAQFCGAYRPGPIYVVRRRIGRSPETLYTGPTAKQVPKLMKNFVSWLDQTKTEEVNPVIVAALAHLEIAAIHPFNDGNGRTARAVATLLLYQRGYDFRRLFALEDYYNTDRPSYYQAISLGKTYQARQVDCTSWIEYFTTGVRKEIDRVRQSIIGLSAHAVDGKIQSQVYLTAEQLKIIDFLDQMGRLTVSDVEDILSTPKRSAQLQVQKLKKLKLIKSVGKAKATYYISNS